jgi:hypothetical protein
MIIMRCCKAQLSLETLMLSAVLVAGMLLVMQALFQLSFAVFCALEMQKAHNFINDYAYAVEYLTILSDGSTYVLYVPNTTDWYVSFADSSATVAVACGDRTLVTTVDVSVPLATSFAHNFDAKEKAAITLLNRADGIVVTSSEYGDGKRSSFWH